MSIRYRRSLSSLATPPSGRVVNSIRVPFFVRPPARSPVLSRNSIRKAGGMHQLVKLRYLTCLYPPPPFLPLGASAPLGLPSVTISFRSPSSRVRDFGSWQRFRSSCPPSFEIETTRERETESTWPRFARRPFLPLHSPRDIYRICLLDGFARISLVHVRSLSYIFFQPRPKGHAVFVRSFPWKRVLPAALFRRFFRLVLPSGYLTRGRYLALFRLHNFISTRKAATQVSPLFIASDSTLLPV